MGRDMFTATTGSPDYGIRENVGELFFLFSFHIGDDYGYMFSSGDLPKDPPLVGNIGKEYLANQFVEPMHGGSWMNASDHISNLRISAIKPVPEPSTLILLGSGLASMASCRKKYLRK